MSEDIIAEALARTRRDPAGAGAAAGEEEEGVLVISDDAAAAAVLVRRAAGARRVVTSEELGAMVAGRLAQSAGSSPVRPNLVGLLSATVDQARAGLLVTGTLRDPHGDLPL